MAVHSVRPHSNARFHHVPSVDPRRRRRGGRTWPVEWKQLSPFLGWQDYMWTGRPDLALAFGLIMQERTMFGYN